MLNDNEENDTTVSWADQKAINEFSRLDVVLADARAMLAQQRDDKEALDDLVMEIELVDEDDKVPYLVGSTFVHLSQDAALERAQADAQRVEKRIEELETEADDAESAMKDLKVKLYARFGTSISTFTSARSSCASAVFFSPATTHGMC